MNNENFNPLVGINLDFVFQKQKEIFLEYMIIEQKDFCLESFDINTLSDQQLFKDFMEIRVIEELTESTLSIGSDLHFKEELIDAFNFLIESYILYGWDYKNLPIWDDDINFNSDNLYENFYKVVESIGACCNILKNRPWKESQYLVDLYKFEPLFKEVWITFNKLCNSLSFSLNELLEIWSLKYQVNKFRLETKY